MPLKDISREFLYMGELQPEGLSSNVSLLNGYNTFVILIETLIH